jgi:hypothetical protein
MKEWMDDESKDKEVSWMKSKNMTRTTDKEKLYF